MPSLSKAEKQKLIESVPFWYHSIDVGDGLITPGKRSIKQMRDMFGQFQLGDLSGKTVIDIGAWDGWNAYECERRGARRVTALDRLIWSYDTVRPDLIARFKPVLATYHRVPNYHVPGHWPGKRGFDAAHLMLNSMVEQYVDDIETVDVNDLGTFDVALCIGVLYHMRDPYGMMRKVANIARDFAIIETEGIDDPRLADAPHGEWFPHAELNADVSNWFAPNDVWLIEMAKSAGFAGAEVLAKNPGQKAIRPNTPDYCRWIIKAWH